MPILSLKGEESILSISIAAVALRSDGPTVKFTADKNTSKPYIMSGLHIVKKTEYNPGNNPRSIPVHDNKGRVRIVTLRGSL